MQDYNGVMDNIMQQLLSRELMYDPIKQVSLPWCVAASPQLFGDGLKKPHNSLSSSYSTDGRLADKAVVPRQHKLLTVCPKYLS